MTNQTIANQLRSYAAELARQGDNLYRIRAIRRAALNILALPQPIEQILQDGGQIGFQKMAGIGPSLADEIRNFTLTGEWKPAHHDNLNSLAG
jgi:holliday junction DNA helicase RuvA